jgi:hypothetical protein
MCTSSHRTSSCIIVPGCDWRIQAGTCEDAHYKRVFTTLWQAVLGVYFIALLCCTPVTARRLKALQAASRKLKAGATWRDRLRCAQTADVLVLQLISAIVLRLVQSALLFLHADKVLHRVVFEIMYELCTYTSLTFVLTFLGFMGKLLARLMGRRKNSRSSTVKQGTLTCKLLTAKQLRILDSSALVLLMVLAFIDGFWSHLRGIATWWLMVCAASLPY